MKLLWKIDNLTCFLIGLFRLSYFRLLLTSSFKIGKNALLKNTSRINIWDKKGTIYIGDDFSMGYNSELYSWNEQLTIGAGTSLNDNCKIYGSVTIGSNCLFASNVFISSGTHSFSNEPSLPIKAQDKLHVINKPIIIEDDCWLGFGVVVMPGVYIGKGAIIGANAVVTKDVFPYTIHGGIPNCEIGKRLEFSNAYSKITAVNPNHWPFFYKGCNYRQFNHLTSLKNGIEIVDNISVFLLSKNSLNKLKIKGFSDLGLKLKVFLNEFLCEKRIANKGFFEVSVNLLDRATNYPEFFDLIPKNLKDKFEVVMIEVESNNNEEASSAYKWKVSSIGYHED